MVNAVRIATATMGAINVARQTRLCPTSPSCPANDGCTYTSPVNGAVFKVVCSTDFYGNDFQTLSATSYAECLQACGATKDCVAISYTGPYCYLKNKVPKAVTNTSVRGATLVGSPKATATPKATAFCPGSSITCPAYNNCIFAAGLSGLRMKPFVIACSTDFYGGDVRNLAANTTSDCVNGCAVQSDCIAVSYVPAEKRCYQKSTLKPGLYNPNIVAAFVRQFPN